MLQAKLIRSRDLQCSEPSQLHGARLDTWLRTVLLEVRLTQPHHFSGRSAPIAPTHAPLCQANFRARMELPIPLLHCDVAGVGKLLSPAERKRGVHCFQCTKIYLPRRSIGAMEDMTVKAREGISCKLSRGGRAVLSPSPVTLIAS